MTAKVKYLRCKTKGHWWDDYIPQADEWASVTVYPTTAEHEFSRCVGECGGTRYFQVDAQGHTIDRRYHMPFDYKWDGVKEDKPTRAEMRLMRLKRDKGSKRRLKAI